jgi:flagellar biosynthesis chaperone FliJ
MTQPYRGPLVLTLAGILLFCAVVAYLIGDLESNARRQEAALVDQELLRDYRRWSTEFHAQLDHQRAAISETRKRLDELTRRLGTMNDELAKLKGVRVRQTPLHSSDDDRWPVVSGK